MSKLFKGRVNQFQYFSYVFNGSDVQAGIFSYRKDIDKITVFFYVYKKLYLKGLVSYYFSCVFNNKDVNGRYLQSWARTDKITVFLSF